MTILTNFEGVLATSFCFGKQLLLMSLIGFICLWERTCNLHAVTPYCPLITFRLWFSDFYNSNSCPYGVSPLAAPVNVGLLSARSSSRKWSACLIFLGEKISKSYYMWSHASLPNAARGANLQPWCERRTPTLTRKLSNGSLQTKL